MTHDLKTHLSEFQKMWDGVKKFEFRKTDRPFGVGDHLHLFEWDPTEQRFTGRALSVTVDYILPGGSFGLPVHFCIMSITVNNKIIEPEKTTHANNS